MSTALSYGDNLEVLREHIREVGAKVVRDGAGEPWSDHTAFRPVLVKREHS